MKIDRRECLSALSAVAGATALSPARAAGQFKMGLLVPGSVAEEGWNRIAYSALKQVEAQVSIPRQSRGL